MKRLWTIAIVIGLGFVIFNNFNQSLDIVQEDLRQLISLGITIVISTVYITKNKKEIFK